MPDWDDTVEALNETRPALPVESSLWTLTKGTRTAEARVRPHPQGRELRFLVNGELVRSFRPGRGAALDELADTKWAEFEARGWQGSAP